MAVDSFDLPPPSKRVINQQAGSMISTYSKIFSQGVRRCKMYVHELAQPPSRVVQVIVCIVATLIVVGVGLLLDACLGRRCCIVHRP